MYIFFYNIFLAKMNKTIQYMNTILRIFRTEFQQESLQSLQLKMNKQGVLFDLDHGTYNKKITIHPTEYKLIETTVRKYK